MVQNEPAPAPRGVGCAGIVIKRLPPNHNADVIGDSGHHAGIPLISERNVVRQRIPLLRYRFAGK